MLKERKSNFELLRIVSILMIIAFHYCIHGNDSSIIAGELSGNQIVSVLLGSWGILGVDLFVFISAYFLIDSKHYKIEKVILIALTTWFYAIILLIIMSMAKVTPFDFRNTLKTVVSPLTDQYWFIPAYIMLFVIYPFLNRFIKAISKTALQYLIIVLTVEILIYRFVISSAPIHTFAYFIYLYLLMAYFKRYPNNFFEKNSKKGFFIWYSVVVVGYISWLIIDNYLHIGIYSKVYTRTLANRYSPILLLLAIFLFYIFKNIKISNSKIINNMAKSTLGIYLIHENPSLRNVLWDKWLHIEEVYYKPTYILFMILSVALIFVVCYCIDVIRINTLEKYIVVPLIKRSKWIPKINKIFNGIMNPHEGTENCNITTE